MERRTFEKDVSNKNRQITISLLKYLNMRSCHFNIPALQLQILLMISEVTATVSECSASFGMAKSNMSTLLKMMEKDHLIKRVKDNKDERRTLIVLSPHGSEIVNKYYSAFSHNEFPIMNVSDKEKETIINGMDLLISVLEREIANYERKQ